eukprot:5909896-Pleurochrysis_carterae.AAC.2
MLRCEEHTSTVCALPSTGVGKTSLLRRYASGRFEPEAHERPQDCGGQIGRERERGGVRALASSFSRRVAHAFRTCLCTQERELQARDCTAAVSKKLS